MENENRIVAIDLIKGISIIMIILTHVSTIPIDIKRYMLYPYTVLSAVPIFVIGTAYVFWNSWVQDDSIWMWFERRCFGKRVARLLRPYLMIFLFLVIIINIISVNNMSIEGLLEMFLKGGRGPGAYYVSIAFQILFVFPWIAKAFQREPLGTICVCCILALGWEGIVELFDISVELYKYVCIRFFPHMILGMCLKRYFYNLKNTYLPEILMLTGGVFSMDLVFGRRT